LWTAGENRTRGGTGSMRLEKSTKRKGQNRINLSCHTLDKLMYGDPDSRINELGSIFGH